MGWHHENMKYINYETDCACRDENESDTREEGKFYNVLLNVHVFGLWPQIKKREYFERTLWGNHLENFSCRFKSATKIKKTFPRSRILFAFIVLIFAGFLLRVEICSQNLLTDFFIKQNLCAE